MLRGRATDRAAIRRAESVAKSDGSAKRETQAAKPTPAERALEEAAARRARKEPPPAREINGRDGPEPTRYGDWEVRGIASDF